VPKTSSLQNKAQAQIDDKQKILNSMSEIDAKLPDLKYRLFMLELSRQFTSKDTEFEEMQYILTSMIPAGKMESLDSTLKLFRHLEKLAIFGPDDLGGLKFLEGLFRKLGKHKLSAMVERFIDENIADVHTVPHINFY
jgi:hypothetical protein